MSREDDDLSRRVVQRLRKMEAERAPCSELPKIYETGGVNPTPPLPMTNTPSSTDEDRGLIDGGVGLRAAAKNIEYARNRACVEGLAGWEHRVVREAADRLESLLADRAKLENLLTRVWACRMEAGEGRFVNLAKLRPVIAEIGDTLNRSTDRG